MKNLLLALIVVASGVAAWYSYVNFNGEPIFAAEFVCGLVFGIFIMNIFMNIKNRKLNKYKRALEKECVESSENSSKVKVLESKIQVLEKALENALGGSSK